MGLIATPYAFALKKVWTDAHHRSIYEGAKYDKVSKIGYNYCLVGYRSDKEKREREVARMIQIQQKNGTYSFVFRLLTLVILIFSAIVPIYAENSTGYIEESYKWGLMSDSQHSFHYRSHAPLKALLSTKPEPILLMAPILLRLGAWLAPAHLYAYIPVRMKRLLLMPIKYTSNFVHEMTLPLMIR